MSFDVMHDINEGVIPYTLSDFFELVVTKKILTVTEIQKRVRDFNYSCIQKYNKPSLINIDKHNLNQNASHLYCLMIHMPFIFWDLKDGFGELWQPIEFLYKCMQIIYSETISECDIKSFEKYIEQYLSSVREVFKRNLTPKHHFLLHYPDLIRRMGPPILLWTMRLESKYKVLTEIARTKMNFINLSKTLATEHQQRICKQPNSSSRTIPSKVHGNFSKSMQFRKYESIISSVIGTDFDKIRVHKFAKYDNIQYREGSLLIENDRVYEIENILSIDSNVFFVCVLHKVLCYDAFFNGLMIEKENNRTIVFSFDTIKNKMVHNKLYVADKYYVIAEKLNILI